MSAANQDYLERMHLDLNALQRIIRKKKLLHNPSIGKYLTALRYQGVTRFYKISIFFLRDVVRGVR